MGAKVPRFGAQPQVSKTAKATEKPDEYWRRFPAWRIARVEFIAPWGWHELTAEQVRAIHSKLSEFERMTWDEILIRSKKQNHLVRVEIICKQARDRLGEIGYGDQERLVSLHFSGRERVWGALSDGVMTVLWWDPRLEICPCLK